MLEVQQYLFSREAGFLHQLGHMPAVVRRSQAFIRQHYHTLRAMPPDLLPPECAQLWAFLAGWTVHQAAEEHLKAQKEQLAGEGGGGGGSEEPAAMDVSTSISSSSKKQSPPSKTAASATPPRLQASASSSSVGLLPNEEQLVLMSRQLSEVLDFCRLRLLEVATALLGADLVWASSFVCAARRELAAGPLPDLHQPLGGHEGGARSPVSLDDISLKVQRGGATSPPLLSAPEGGEGASSSSSDPRRVCASLSSLLSRSPWLRETLSSVPSFDEHYLKMTETLARHLERAARDRSMGRVQAERAAVLLKMGEVEDARRLLRALAEGVFRRDGWAPILSHILSQLALCERERGNSRTYVSALLQVLPLGGAHSLRLARLD